MKRKIFTFAIAFAFIFIGSLNAQVGSELVTLDGTVTVENLRGGEWINITDTTVEQVGSVGVGGGIIQMLQLWEPADFTPGFPLAIEKIYFVLANWNNAGGDPEWSPNTVEVLIYDESLEILYTSGEFLGDQGGNTHELDAPLLLDPLASYYIGVSAHHNAGEYPVVYLVSDAPDTDKAFIGRWWVTPEGEDPGWNDIINVGTALDTDGGWWIELLVDEPSFDVSVNDLSVKVAISPNPTSGIISVYADGNYNVEVIDLSGRVISTTNMVNNVATVDISSAQAGIYLVRVNGTVHKVVKN